MLRIYTFALAAMVDPNDIVDIAERNFSNHVPTPARTPTQDSFMRNNTTFNNYTPPLTTMGSPHSTSNPFVAMDEPMASPYAGRGSRNNQLYRDNTSLPARNLPRSAPDNEREAAIANMEAMGFARADVDKAMQAAHFNPDRAVEYLLTVSNNDSSPR